MKRTKIFSFSIKINSVGEISLSPYFISISVQNLCSKFSNSDKITIVGDYALLLQNLFPFVFTYRVAGICAGIIGCRCRCVVRMLGIVVLFFSHSLQISYQDSVRCLYCLLALISVENPICCVKDSNSNNIL